MQMFVSRMPLRDYQGPYSPLIFICCCCYLLFHVGASDTVRSSQEYEGLQSTGRSGKRLWSAGNFSSILLFKAKGSERASWMWRINKWLITGLVPQTRIWLLQIMGLSLRNLVSWGLMGSVCQRRGRASSAWALNQGTSIHPTRASVVPVPTRDDQSLQRDHTEAGEHLKSSTRNSSHSSQLHWGNGQTGATWMPLYNCTQHGEQPRGVRAMHMPAGP